MVAIARRHLRDQRRHVRGDQAFRAEVSCRICSHGLLARFEGYFPGYSKLISGDHDYLSWVILKAHTRQPSRRRETHISRSARPAGDQFPLL